MSSRRLLLATFLCAAVFGVATMSAFAAAAQVEIRHVDSDAFPVVSITVLVTGDAQPSDISVRENGTPVDSPAVKSLGSASQQIDVVLALDTSGSMSGAPLSSAIAAARSFLSAAPSGVRVGLLTFADKPIVVQPITSDHGAVDTALGTITATGNTGLFDAVTASTQMFSGSNQRNIILLTDGKDTASKATLRSAIGASKTAKAAIYSIALTTTETDFTSLQSLSADTGGLYTAAASGDLTAVYGQILTVLTSQFVITYETHVPRGSSASIVVSALGASATYTLKAPPPLAPRPTPAHSPVPAPIAIAHPLLAGTWGFVIALGLAFLAVYFLCLLLLLPGVRIRREREIARRVGMPAPSAAVASERGDRTLGAYFPTLVAMGDRLADAGGFTLALEMRLERAGLPITAGELVTASGLSVVLGAVVGGFTFQSVFFAVVGAVAFAAAPFVIVQILARRRMNRLHEQLPDVLMILATSLRSGHSFLQALDTVSKEAADPGAREFSRIVAEVRLGRPLEEAMNGMADRVGSDDFRWAVLAVNIQREVGGNLPEVLDTVAETLRDRDNVRRQIDTLSTEGKLSLYILMALPVFIGLYVFKFSRDYLDPLLHTTGGLFMLGGAAVMMTIGYLWMRKIVSIDV